MVINYYEQLYASKKDKPEETNFFKKHNLPRLNQEETEYMNRPITSNKIEILIKNLPTNRSADGFRGEFYNTFRKEVIPIILKLFKKKKNGDRETLLNSFYKATITLIWKPDKNIAKRKIAGQYHWWT